MPDKHVQKLLRRELLQTLVGSTPLETWVFVKDDGASTALCDAVPATPKQFQTTWGNGVDGSRPRSFLTSTLSIKTCHGRPR